MLKFLGYALLAIIAIAAGLLLYVRLAGHDASVWHVDPLTAPTPQTPNSWRVVPAGTAAPTAGQVSALYAAKPADLMAALEKVALAEADTIRLAGGDEGYVTYVQRTPLVKYPDYVSVRAIDAGNGQSTLALLSRSRYGKSDLGVNKARVERWLAGLAPLEAPPTTTIAEVATIPPPE